ncbi:MAG: flagellin N-terminal helical domain-containing protein [Planctomycetota bacterium]|jgi:flagellin
MLAIKNNIMAANAARHLGKSYNALARSVERLSSGLRINSAKDDAAGLAVRELLRADIAVLRQAGRNAADGISMIQTAEGAMGEVDTLLIRMRELAEQAATGSYSSDQRTIMHNEYAELASEITRIAESTDFNNNLLLNSTTGVNIHVGSGNITITPQNMDAPSLTVGTTVATKETWVHLRTVNAASDTYLTGAEITAATGTGYQFVYYFGDTNATTITVDLSAYDTQGITLTELVTEINTAVTSATGTAYTAASALYNADDGGSYRLQMQARNTGDYPFVISDNGTNTDSIGLLNATADFSESINGTTGGTGNSLTSATGAAAALTTIETAITVKDTYRAKLGYWMNRLEAAESVLNVQAENLLTSESRISDVDVATEMAEMTRTQVLAQAGVAMLAQANSMPQMALTLLR